MAEKLDVTIKTNPPGAPTCIAEHFIAGRGKTVIFKFPEFPNADLILPNGSPFEKGDRLKPGPHKVKENLPPAQNPKEPVQFCTASSGRIPPATATEPAKFPLPAKDACCSSGGVSVCRGGPPRSSPPRLHVP